MPSGCDFICKNKECKQYDSGFVMTAPWPMGKIELVINDPNVKNKKEFRDKLIKLKNENQKYACITYPNVTDIETVAYQVHFWCENCSCLWKYEVVLTEEYPTFKEALAKDILDKKIPDKCFTCNSPLLAYNDVLEKGIVCPHCKEKLQQDGWIAKEMVNESTYKKEI